MTALATGVSSTHTYRNTSEINFILDDEKLTVTIDTERLHIRSVEDTEKDVNSYVSLWGDGDVMKKYHLGVVRTREEIHDRIKNVWAKGWHEKDPYHGLAIFNRTTDEFIGPPPCRSFKLCLRCLSNQWNNVVLMHRRFLLP